MQNRWRFAATLAAGLTLSAATGARAQERGPQRAARLGSTLNAPADVTRDELARILEQYPPTLSDVLRLDPSLLTNHDYLKLYPALDAFLAAHPDVVHNPGYFFGSIVAGRGGRFYVQPAQPSVRESAMREVRVMAEGFTVLAGLMALMGLVGWGLKTFVEHRRWLRLSKIQADAHSKLLDRLTSNEDLLTYIQSPAGRQFLEASPLPTIATRQAIAAPVNRILWSVQAGVVLALFGLGLLYARGQIADFDFGQPLGVLGVLSMFLGAGFVVSALVAYILSRALGLFTAPALHPHA